MLPSDDGRTHIKICCISSEQEAQLAAECGADLIGLVGPMPSGPGILDHAAANAIARTAPQSTTPVLLTSSQTAPEILSDAEEVGVQTVQVVRHVTKYEAERLADSSLTYIQVIHVEDDSALDLIPRYAPHCEAFLLDSGHPSGNTFGGTGETHDWEISAAFCRAAPKPTFLAGGLTPQNIREAIDIVNPYGIDVCSGVRKNGKLDQAILRGFIAAITQNADP